MYETEDDYIYNKDTGKVYVADGEYEYDGDPDYDLTKAVCLNDIEKIKEAIENGAGEYSIQVTIKENGEKREHCDLIDIAAENGSIEAVNILHEADNYMESTVERILEKRPINEELLQACVNAGGKIEYDSGHLRYERSSLLAESIEKYDIEAVKALVNVGANLKYEDGCDGEKGFDINKSLKDAAAKAKDNKATELVIEMARYIEKHRNPDKEIANETISKILGIELHSAVAQNESKPHIATDFSTTLKAALATENATTVVKVMHLNGRLKENLPEVDRLFEIPERTDFHPEGNSGEHTLLTMKEVREDNPEIAAMMRYAMLVHDLGKVVTFDEQKSKADEKGEPYEVKDLTKHFGHAEKGIALVDKISDTLQVPEEWKEFASLVCKQHMKAHDLDKMKDSKLFDFNQEIPDRFYEPLMKCCLADALGRDIPAEQKEQIKADFAIKKAKVDDVRHFMKSSNSDKNTFANDYAKYKKEHVM